MMSLLVVQNFATFLVEWLGTYSSYYLKICFCKNIPPFYLFNIYLFIFVGGGGGGFGLVLVFEKVLLDTGTTYQCTLAQKPWPNHAKQY